MKFRFFAVPAHMPEVEQDRRNAFCAQQRVVAVDKELVAQGATSFWAICVCYVDGKTDGSRHGGSKRGRVDYKEILGDTDFAIYASLRALRKTLAEREGVPPYAIFNNEQLAEIVTRRVASREALAAIEGIGVARIEKYGTEFLQLLQQVLPATPSDETHTHRPE